MKLGNTNRAVVFPGQGSQAVGMGKNLAETFPVARQTFDEINDALNEPLSRLMFDGPENTLTLTRNAQPALMAVSIAVLRVVEQETGQSIENLADCVAGHSLGEYSALTATGALNLADSARLLRLRGESMQLAVPEGNGAMAAFLGAEMEFIKNIAEVSSKKGACELANDNGPGQIVLSGAKDAVEHSIKLAYENGIRKAIMLPVSAPFHCNLMEPAALKMENALAEISICAPSLPLITNVHANPISSVPDEIRKCLVDQVTKMVRWRESIMWMAANGIQTIVEMGAGKILTGLHKRIDRKLMVYAVSQPEDIDQFIKTL